MRGSGSVYGSLSCPGSGAQDPQADPDHEHTIYRGSNHQHSLLPFIGEKIYGPSKGKQTKDKNIRKGTEETEVSPRCVFLHGRIRHSILLLAPDRMADGL